MNINNYGIHLVKSLYIIYLGIMYVTFGSTLSILFKGLEDKLFPQYDDLLDNFKSSPEKMSNSVYNMNLLHLTTLTDITMVVLVAYLSRIIVKKIPFGFNGVFGFKTSIVKEINGGIILAICIFTFFNRFRDKLDIYFSIWKINKTPILILFMYIIMLIIIVGISPSYLL